MKFQRIFQELGLEGLIKPKGENRLTTLPIINAIPLWRNFDLGFALDQHQKPLESGKKRTPMGELVYRFKYGFDQNAGLIIADLAANFIEEKAQLRSVDFLISVPPSFISRPFDPLTFLVDNISEKTGIRIERNILARTRISKPQKKVFNLKEKIDNVALAFCVKRKEMVRGKKILLMDDLYDSGATLNQVANLLKSSLAQEVFALVLTKTAYISSR